MVKPFIVLVPGSFAAAWAYKDLISKLRAKGYPALEIILPSTQKRMPLEPATMSDDAREIRGVAEALVAQNKEVVVMCHSYGGVPTTQALAGVPVKRIIYLTSIAPKVGQCHRDAMPGPMIQGLIDSAVGGYMHNNEPHKLASGVGNDTDSWDLAYEAAQQLPYHSAASYTEEVTQIGYENVPVSYILTEKDVIVTPELQEQYIKNIEEAQGKKIDVIKRPWGHCPNWSYPDALIEVLIGEAEK